ncbi:MAG: hypothetical protein EPN21_13220 [Methylococcaceae bacterium]|nr:MAG: hypothetical protein EPN21_13220 [Methylococcaceae bacterium]
MKTYTPAEAEKIIKIAVTVGFLLVMAYAFAPAAVKFWIMAGIFVFAFFVKPVVSIALWVIRGVSRW